MIDEQEALNRILYYALEFEWRDYRAALRQWEADLAELQLRKPVPPKRAVFTTEDWS